MTPLAKLIYDSITFANLAAGEGLGLTDDKGVTHWPEEFLMEYSRSTYDLDWERMAEVIANHVEMLERVYKNMHIGDGKIWRD